MSKRIALSIVVLAGLVWSTPAQALEPDSDGKVPVHNVCDRSFTMFAGMFPELAGASWIGRTWTHAAGRKTEAYIFVNTCVMQDRGILTLANYQIVLRHEYGHAAGWEHGEGTPETNSAYYPHYFF